MPRLFENLLRLIGLAPKPKAPLTPIPDQVPYWQRGGGAKAYDEPSFLKMRRLQSMTREEAHAWHEDCGDRD